MGPLLAVQYYLLSLPLRAALLAVKLVVDRCRATGRVRSAVVATADTECGVLKLSGNWRACASPDARLSAQGGDLLLLNSPPAGARVATGAMGRPGACTERVSSCFGKGSPPTCQRRTSGRRTALCTSSTLRGGHRGSGCSRRAKLVRHTASGHRERMTLAGEREVHAVWDVCALLLARSWPQTVVACAGISVWKVLFSGGWTVTPLPGVRVRRSLMLSCRVDSEPVVPARDL